MLHRRSQRHAVSAGVALHALGLAGGPRGVEDVVRFTGLEPGDRHVGVRMLPRQRGVVEVTPGGECHVPVDAAVDDHHIFRRRRRQPDRLVHQVLVGNRLAAAHSRVRRHHQLRPCIVDAGRQARRCETSEHHRVDGADARARQHRENRLGDHRHVNQYALALPRTEALQHRGEAVHLCMQFAVTVGAFLPGFRGDVNQRFLVAARGEMPVERVMAEIGQSTDEPLRKRRTTVVEDTIERPMPMDQARLFGPELFTFLDRAPIELGIFPGHAPPSRLRFPCAFA